MPAINKPPIGLTDQEILCVIAYLQTLGGTPTVTLQTSHTYYTAPRRDAGRGAGRAGRRLASSCLSPRRQRRKARAEAPPAQAPAAAPPSRRRRSE